MFHVLVRTIRARHPALLVSPFSVGELHHQILPYRHFRRELELETNQEYELLLMELVTGARGYLDVDEKLRDGLGKELASQSPEPSRVRDYAEANVSLNATAAARVATTPPAGSEASQPTPLTTAAVAPVAADELRCRYCSAALPTARSMNFCPHCGQNLQVLNCPACGAEVEAG